LLGEDQLQRKRAAAVENEIAGDDGGRYYRG
jgi:hypothetical protein